MFRVAATPFLVLLLLAGVARPEVTDSQPSGFTVRESRVIAAPPSKVWATLIDPAVWWNGEHSFSGDSRNFTFEPRPGGEWLEALPGGGGRHMVVVMIDPPKTLRLEGALGPLQSLGIAGHLTYKLVPQDGGTLVTATYDVGGHAPGGLDKLASPVDGVLDEQVGRLKTRAEGGAPP